MAYRKHLTLAFALLAVSVFAFGCAEDATVPGQQQDEAPVLAPTNVQATAADGGSIVISWSASSQANVVGYNVYRVDLTDHSVDPLNSSPLLATSIIDRSARFGREYEYRVTAVNDRNTESRFATVTIRNREAPPQDRRDRRPDDLD
jgi:fibronectin type 3 domain-containing protein